MKQIVYADILIIVNTYVNYGLLRLCSLICHYNTKRWRIVLSAFFGGIYSFVILVPKMPTVITVLLKAAFAFVAVYIAFGFKNKSRFFRLFVSFFAVSFAFAGIMILLWTAFLPEKMYYNNSVVYFDISTLHLAVMTVVCYAAVFIADKIIRTKAPKNMIYDITVDVGGKTFEARAFLDTGNSVREPFSSFPVIIINGSINDIKKTVILKEHLSEQIPMRYIPCESIAGGRVLTAFRPDNIHIKGIEESFDTDEIYMALTDIKIKGGDFDALLNILLFEDQTIRKDAAYAARNHK